MQRDAVYLADILSAAAGLREFSRVAGPGMAVWFILNGTWKSKLEIPAYAAEPEQPVAWRRRRPRQTTSK